MNSNWQIDLFSGLEKATNMQDVLDHSLKIIRPFGFDYCGFRALLPLPLATKKIMTLNAVEDEVFKKEMEGNYLKAPMSIHCSQSMTPFYWQGSTTDDVFKQAPDIFEEYYGLGHHGGWAQSIIEKRNTYSLFIADSSNIFTLADIHHVNFKMEWVATAVLSKMNLVRMNPDITLSVREKEILQWTGDGKTADQISEILTLSPSTINFHLRNAMRKLEAPNKTTAVVRAIYLGLLC